MSQENYKSLDDIVFEHRNKEYGAYDLRKSQHSNLMRALLVGVALIGLVTAGIFLYNVVLSKQDREETVVDINLMDVEQPDIPEEEIKPEEPEPEPEKQPEVAEVRVVVPEPKADVKKEEPIVKVQEMENKLIGTKNVEGDASTSTKGKSEPERPKSDGQGTKPAPAIVNYSARQVKDMAVYPGCDKFSGDKAKLTQCLQQKLTEELIDQLADFGEVMNSRGESVAIAKIQFVIDKGGNIVQVQAMKGAGGGINDQLSKESEKAIQRIAQRLSSRGKMIKPAKLDDGSSANLIFQLPVKYQISN